MCLADEILKTCRFLKDEESYVTFKSCLKKERPIICFKTEPDRNEVVFIKCTT